MIAIAGPNGAGKTTFYHSFLATSGLRFVNADEIGLRSGIDAYAAADAADAIRRALVISHESFVFETVFSDPTSAKIRFLEDAAAQGYKAGERESPAVVAGAWINSATTTTSTGSGDGFLSAGPPRHDDPATKSARFALPAARA